MILSVSGSASILFRSFALCEAETRNERRGRSMRAWAVAAGPHYADYTPQMIEITLPSWIDGIAKYGDHYKSIDDRMRLCIELARRNIEDGNGGPFGAAVFERDSGRL